MGTHCALINNFIPSRHLNRDTVRCACAYRPSHKTTYTKPEWSDEHNLGKSFAPSHNIAPTDVTPVLVSAGKFRPAEAEERMLKPMMWGMVPPWHKGEYSKHGLSTNNCRLENIGSSKLYGQALREGYRCVVVAEGFYEWQTTDKTVNTKQPYFIYAAQEGNIQVDDPSTWQNEFDETNGWKGVKLLKMAGLYNVWSGSDGPLYSYSVITLESNSTMNWLHHRMPAILNTEELVSKWLDTDNVNSNAAVALIKPVSLLSWHAVSTLVNNSRNKSEQCNRRVDIEKKEKTSSGSQKMMSAWLGKAGKRKQGDSGTESKRVKRED